MDLSLAGKWLIAGGVVLTVLGLLSAWANSLLGTVFSGFFWELGWIIIIAGVTLWIVSRRTVGTAIIKRRLRFHRHDIIKSTNWKRLGGAELRRPIGTSLIVIGFILLVIELALGVPYPLLFIWLILIALGVILLLWYPYSIEYDFTQKFIIKIPDLLSIHTIHTLLRQCMEDAGYFISENISPGEGSSLSEFKNNIFILNGGIKAFKKKISASKSIVPEFAGTPIISGILSLFGMGILLLFLGITLIAHCMTNWEYEDWMIIVQILGLILVILGVFFLLYDYISRMKRNAEIYALEEGSAYVPSMNIYDSKTIEKQGLDVEPNISLSQTSCELVITLSAYRNRFFEATELENDFKKIAESVENLITENMLKAKKVISALYEEGKER